MEGRRLTVAGRDEVIERLGCLLDLKAERVVFHRVGVHGTALPCSGAGLAMQLRAGGDDAADAGAHFNRLALGDLCVAWPYGVGGNLRLRVGIDSLEGQQEASESIRETRCEGRGVAGN